MVLKTANHKTQDFFGKILQTLGFTDGIFPYIHILCNKYQDFYVFSLKTALFMLAKHNQRASVEIYKHSVL